MEITRIEAQARLFNEDILELLVNDNEYGMALAELDSLGSNGYFEKSISERAELLAEMIQQQTWFELKYRIKKILKNNEKEKTV